MQTSTPASPKPSQPRSILLIGPPGGGKTTLLLQFPNLCVFDCDLNLDGPERYLRHDRKLPLSYAYDPVPLKEDGTPRPVEECYDYLIQQLKPEKVAAYDWVAIDSLSQINEFIIRKILAEQRKSEMEPRHWQPFKTCAMTLLVGRLRHLGKNVIVTAHETKIVKPAGPQAVMQEVVIGYEPFFQGKVGEILGAFFTDMWRCTSEAAPADKKEFHLYTAKTPLSDLKCSYNMPKEFRNPTYEMLSQHL